MKQRTRQPQQLDRNDPIVARFLVECMIATTPVKIKLTADVLNDLILQVQRLQQAYGSLVHFGEYSHNRVADEWMIFGTLLA